MRFGRQGASTRPPQRWTGKRGVGADGKLIGACDDDRFGNPCTLPLSPLSATTSTTRFYSDLQFFIFLSGIKLPDSTGLKSTVSLLMIIQNNRSLELASSARALRPHSS